MSCSSCDTPSKPGSRFCVQCGQRLGQSFRELLGEAPLSWRRVFQILAATCAADPAGIGRCPPDELCLVTRGDVELFEVPRRRARRETRRGHAAGVAALDRGDGYVIGAIGYELVTGSAPKPQPTPPSALNPFAKMPASADALLLACLADRHHDLAGLAQAFTDVLDDKKRRTSKKRSVTSAFVRGVSAASPCTSKCTQPHRVLPSPNKEHVGYWMFFDHFIDGMVARGAGSSHPHAGMATLVYLFEGKLIHRDGLGTTQVIKPNAAAWLDAGRGVMRAEQRDKRDALRGAPYHGIELWCALPSPHEDAHPAFTYCDTLPSVVVGGVRVRIVLGEGFGARSPIATPLPVALFDMRMPAGAAARLPMPPGTAVRGVYTVAGAVDIEGIEVRARHLAMLAPHTIPTIRAGAAGAHVIVVASARPTAPFYYVGAFAASSKERLAALRKRAFGPPLE